MAKLYEKYKGSRLVPLKLDDKFELPNLSIDQLELLESIWETYKDNTGNSLEALTHSEPPWINARIGLSMNESSKNVISLESMKEYYITIYNGGEA